MGDLWQDKGLHQGAERGRIVFGEFIQAVCDPPSTITLMRVLIVFNLYFKLVEYAPTHSRYQVFETMLSQ